MESPRTYVGYDSKGTRIGSCTAVDANEYLNPEQVQKAIEHIEEVTNEQLTCIRKAIYRLRSDADHAMIIKKTTMDDALSDINYSLDSITPAIVNSISELYPTAIGAHDKLQQSANDAAYNSIRYTEGVVTING